VQVADAVGALESCAGVSIPSPVTRTPSAVASEMMAYTIARPSGSWSSLATKLRSIFRMSSGSRLRLLSDDWPVPKSSIAKHGRERQPQATGKR
jgi:hypothetical protein